MPRPSSRMCVMSLSDLSWFTLGHNYVGHDYTGRNYIGLSDLSWFTLVAGEDEDSVGPSGR